MQKAVLVGIVAVGVTGLAFVLGGRSSTAQGPAGQVDSLAAPMMAVADTGALLGPRQPVFFRHDIHAGQYKINCQYCHYTASESTEPGIPSVATCMGCHLVVSGSDSGGRAEIRKLRTFWNDRNDPAKPKLEWTRIHTLARHAHFPHMRHLKALGPNACQTCHGDVERMPQVFKVNNVNNMGFCVSCHVERQVTRDCSVCHY